MVKRLGSKYDAYSRPTTDTTTKNVGLYSEIICHKLISVKHVALHSFTQVQVKVGSKSFNLIPTKPKHSLWIEHRVCPAIMINEVVAILPFEILLSNFSAVRKKLPKEMVINYVTRSPVIHLTAAGDIAAGIFESLNLWQDQATGATVRHSQTKVTDLSLMFAASKGRAQVLRPLISNPFYRGPSRANMAML